jgi:hypothetical protein
MTKVSDPEIPGDQSSAEVERILHRKPGTLEQFMMDHRTTFQARPGARSPACL